MKLPKFKPRDIIAIVALLGIFCCIVTGHNGTVITFLGMILVYYFGRERSLESARMDKKKK